MRENYNYSTSTVPRRQDLIYVGETTKVDIQYLVPTEAEQSLTTVP